MDFDVDQLYEKTKIPCDEEFLDKIIDKYLSIPYNEMKQTNSMSDDLYKLINYCDVKKSLDENEVNQFKEKIKSDYETISSKAYDLNGDFQLYWDHIKSWHILNTEKIPDDKQLHRFYFGISNDKLYEFTNVLYNELKNAKIPFYFKVSNRNISRVDNLVLFTSTELLQKTIETIDKIQTEHEDLFIDSNKLTPFMGKYSDYIGYGQELPDSKTSYTDTFCIAFEDALNSSLAEYKNTHNASGVIGQKYNTNQNVQEVLNSSNYTPYQAKSIKNRVLCNILINEDPSFKTELLNNYKTKLITLGIDPNNICFNEYVKNDMKQFYNSFNRVR